MRSFLNRMILLLSAFGVYVFSKTNEPESLSIFLMYCGEGYSLKASLIDFNLSSKKFEIKDTVEMKFIHDCGTISTHAQTTSEGIVYSTFFGDGESWLIQYNMKDGSFGYHQQASSSSGYPWGYVYVGVENSESKDQYNSLTGIGHDMEYGWNYISMDTKGRIGVLKGKDFELQSHLMFASNFYDSNKKLFYVYSENTKHISKLNVINSTSGNVVNNLDFGDYYAVSFDKACDDELCVVLCTDEKMEKYYFGKMNLGSGVIEPYTKVKDSLGVYSSFTPTDFSKNLFATVHSNFDNEIQLYVVCSETGETKLFSNLLGIKEELKIEKFFEFLSIQFN